LLILAIDTAATLGSVALVELPDNSQAASVRPLALTAAVLKQHAETLIERIEWCFEISGRKKEDLEAVVYVRGPGSFTGLRTGLATAKGIAIGLDISIVGVSTLKCLAVNVAPHPDPVAVITDARRSEVFVGCYDVSDAFRDPVTLLEEQAAAPAHALSLLEKTLAGRGSCILTGNGIVAYEDVFSQLKAENGWTRAPAFSSTPNVLNAAFLGVLRLIKGESDDVNAAVPVYLRDSGAVPMKSGRDS